MQRRGRFYRVNEADVMKRLGFEPTQGSGAGWREKGDGQSEHLIAQLKLTDASQIAVRKLDLDRLVHNAAVTHKLPVFVVEFLETGDVWLMTRPLDIRDVADALDGADVQMQTGVLAGAIQDAAVGMVRAAQEATGRNQVVITSSADARDEYEREMRKQFDKTKYIGGAKHE